MFLRRALERLKESKRSESMQTKVRWSNVNNLIVIHTWCTIFETTVNMLMYEEGKKDRQTDNHYTEI